MFSALKPKFDFKLFFVGEGPQAAPYFLTHRRVYILPTKQGLAFALLLFIMLLGSINYSNSLGYFLTFLLASLAVVAIFHTYNNLLHLTIGPAICKPVFANEEAPFTVKINNLDHQTRFSIKASTSQGLYTLVDLKENNLSALLIKHVFIQRGFNPLPRFTIESSFPLGLFRAWTFVELAQKILVYPKPSEHSSLPIIGSGLSEGTKQLDTGTDDFKGLRSYAEGDPLQHVHWKNYARHHTLQTKEFSSTTSNELWLNLADTTVKTIEFKLSQLTRWALLADKSNVNYGLKLNNTVIKPNSGKQHLDACLKALALYGLKDVNP